MQIRNLKNIFFKFFYGRGGFPIVMEGVDFRVDESLRRWKFDSEHELRGVFKDLVKTGNIVFDIGANLGLHSIYLAKLTGPDGHVFSFEPVPINLKLLNKNISLNKMTDTISVVSSAVSNIHLKRIQMNIPSDEIAVAASIVVKQKQISDSIIEVNNIRLDDFVQQNNIIPDFIKIDVEGAELEVIRGARETLIKYHPTILMEIHTFALPEFKSSPKQIADFLHELGYKENKISEVEGSSGDYYHSLFLY